MKPVSEMTLDELVAEHKKLLHEEKKSKERREELSKEIHKHHHARQAAEILSKMTKEQATALQEVLNKNKKD